MPKVAIKTLTGFIAYGPVEIQMLFLDWTLYRCVNKHLVGREHLLLDYSPRFIINWKDNVHVRAVGLLSSRHEEKITTLLADL